MFSYFPQAASAFIININTRWCCVVQHWGEASNVGPCLWESAFLFVLFSDLIHLFLLMYSEEAKVGEKRIKVVCLNPFLLSKHYRCNTEAITQCSETAYMPPSCCVESWSASFCKAKNKDGLLFAKL